MLFVNAVPLPISIAAVVHCVYLIIFVTLVGRAPCCHGSFDYHLLFQLASANSSVPPKSYYSVKHSKSTSDEFCSHSLTKITTILFLQILLNKRFSSVKMAIVG